MDQEKIRMCVALENSKDKILELAKKECKEKEYLKLRDLI